MKGDKLPMGSISPTFFVPVFSFSKKHRRELEAHDAPACVMSALEEKVAYWKGLYTAGQRRAPVPNVRHYGKCKRHLKRVPAHWKRQINRH